MTPYTVVVTGASRGLGAAVAREFAGDGVHLAICARDREPLEAVAEEFRGDGADVTALRADVRDEFDIERLMQRAGREGGEIDLVVANAGVYHGNPGETPAGAESYAAFDEHLRTNGRGVFTTIREALPHLADDARVLVPSGRIARETRAGFGSYAISKATAEAVARQFAVDIDQPVGVVDPGQVATDLAGGTGRDPESVAPMFRWAAREAPPEEIDGAIIELANWKRATG